MTDDNDDDVIVLLQFTRAHHRNSCAMMKWKALLQTQAYDDQTLNKAKKIPADDAALWFNMHLTSWLEASLG